MSWTHQAAAAVEEAAPGLFPDVIRKLVAEYATIYSAGDWCVLKQPNVRGYKIGVITRVVMELGGQLRLVKVHECGREAHSEKERECYSCDVKRSLALVDAMEIRGPMSSLHAPRYNGQNPFMPNGPGG
jgi:hypothetical protein